MTYQDFRLLNTSSPDMVLVQNCGWHELPLEPEDCKRGWAGLGNLLHETGAPVIFTSYTRIEAVDDLKRLVEVVLLESEENKMRSHRPRRDMALEEEIGVFYNNFT